MTDKATVGKRLRSLRGERSLIEVSKATGIRTSTLSNYESGLRMPRDYVKDILADYYGMSVGDLFFNENDCSNDYCNI